MDTRFYDKQQERNRELLANSKYLGDEVISQVLDLAIDLERETLDVEASALVSALEKRAAATCLRTLSSLAKINELDHLGGGLELIPSLLFSMLISNQRTRQYTIEHAHTSIGYYSLLSALGYVDETDVVELFRRSLDIAGHVSWLPGGTQLNGGRLGVMIPAAVGQALGLKADHGDSALVICHCGDAGWLSGQALDGFLGAHLHGAPVVFVMNRNGIQLSDTCAHIVNEDPRKLIASCGLEILEIRSIHNRPEFYAALRSAMALASRGQPAMIYPVGFDGMTLAEFGERYEVTPDIRALCEKNDLSLDQKVWVPGSLMSWRDAQSMCECVLHVNNLPGGHGHHDGHMKGRDLQTVLSHPLLELTAQEQAALDKVLQKPRRTVETKARPPVGSPNLVLAPDRLADIQLPAAGAVVSPRSGVQLAYETLAQDFPKQFFSVSCDLDPSTKLDKAKQQLPPENKFEMGITEQASSLMADGLAMSGDRRLVVFATFAAFFEGIAREGMEMWRYQRNLNGINEGLNVTMHLSHVGACTGRDHFSGWSLDWINVAIGMLPYLHRCYTPADARAAFVAVRDLAAHYGGHLIGVPRADVPVLCQQDSDQPLWEASSDWEPVTVFRSADGARKAVLAVGCTAPLAAEAFEELTGSGHPVDVYVINGLPLHDGQLSELMTRYDQGLVTIEDGIIGNHREGIRGFAAIVQTAAGPGLPLAHIGICDPRIAPSHGMEEVWEHFGITKGSVVEAVRSLGS